MVQGGQFRITRGQTPRGAPPASCGNCCQAVGHLSSTKKNAGDARLKIRGEGEEFYDGNMRGEGDNLQGNLAGTRS